VKTGLSHILSGYEIAPCKDTPVPPLVDENLMLLQIKGEVTLFFFPENQQLERTRRTAA
jgi:hypothetical protein